MRKMRGKFRKIVGKFWNKCSEIPKNTEKIIKNIRKFPTAVKKAENAKNPIKIRKYQKIFKIPNHLPRSLTIAYLTSPDIPDLT